VRDFERWEKPDGATGHIDSVEIDWTGEETVELTRRAFTMLLRDAGFVLKEVS
jgi:hypothetical protein